MPIYLCIIEGALVAVAERAVQIVVENVGGRCSGYVDALFVTSLWAGVGRSALGDENEERMNELVVSLRRLCSLQSLQSLEGLFAHRRGRRHTFQRLYRSFLALFLWIKKQKIN